MKQRKIEFTASFLKLSGKLLKKNPSLQKSFKVAAEMESGNFALSYCWATRLSFLMEDSMLAVQSIERTA